MCAHAEVSHHVWPSWAGGDDDIVGHPSHALDRFPVGRFGETEVEREMAMVMNGGMAAAD